MPDRDNNKKNILQSSNTITTLLCSIVSVIVSCVSLVFAVKASNEANNIAAKSSKPNLLFIQGYTNDNRTGVAMVKMCTSVANESVMAAYQIETEVVISNTGGRSISLVGVELITDGKRWYVTLYDGWTDICLVPSFAKQVEVPVKVDSGTSARLYLVAYATFTVSDGSTAEQLVSQQSGELTLPWTFHFGDNTSKSWDSRYELSEHPGFKSGGRC